MSAEKFKITGKVIMTTNQNSCSVDSYLFLVGVYIDELTYWVT